MMSLSKYFQFLSIYIIYKNKAIKLTMEYGHPRLTATQLCTAKVHNATDFQHQAFSPLHKHDNHVATTVEVRENIITKQLCGADQQNGNKCRNILLTCLTGTKATFVKILLVKITYYFIHQNFAPSNICAIRYKGHSRN